ncbi:phosphoenolpyruvate phosphomutase [Streptomyces sp. AS58]|uniref:phosphoenolpyruvate mutase n=1 Tax=Streptomyces sp. MMG1662 TaxID=1415548 RepID=U5YR69_9ACTN|nr:phosphoenolpyruvate mutase [Streptomyces sp. AS58]AGZ93997.1 PEP mutase [Streptomyces sp. MMG1662]KOV62997.1 phosphoenolpyruvate phosphomutase [Streptomyces sp. AS58]
MTVKGSGAQVPRGPASSQPADRLRELLTGDSLSFLMEAHNGLSAKIVQDEGFDAIWASGFSIATAFGVRDSNELSWTQVLDVVGLITEAVSTPVLMDGDTGFGNFNNARRLVTNLCRMGVAGVCIEDKVFPKLNSFVGERHPLAEIDEFCGKIKACKDAQTVPAFSVVARVEALVAGHGFGEAMRRAEAYREAGADAVFIHSKETDGKEILRFAQEWAERCPLIVTPTTYHTVPTDVFEEHGVSAVIWANHMMRASLAAMRSACREIRQTRTVTGVEHSIAPLNEVFELLGYRELEEASRRYLPQSVPLGEEAL